MRRDYPAAAHAALCDFYCKLKYCNMFQAQVTLNTYSILCVRVYMQATCARKFYPLDQEIDTMAKNWILAALLCLGSAGAQASEAFFFEALALYSQEDQPDNDLKIYAAQLNVYPLRVSTEGAPLAEAAFLDRSLRFGAGVLVLEQEGSTFIPGAGLYFDSDSSSDYGVLANARLASAAFPLDLEVSYTHVGLDASDVNYIFDPGPPAATLEGYLDTHLNLNTVAGSIGFWPIRSFRLYVGYELENVNLDQDINIPTLVNGTSTIESDTNTVTVGGKWVIGLPMGDRWINVEAQGRYITDDTTDNGVDLKNAENWEFDAWADLYFSRNVGVGVGYVWNVGEDEDTEGVSAKARVTVHSSKSFGLGFQVERFFVHDDDDFETAEVDRTEISIQAAIRF